VHVLADRFEGRITLAELRRLGFLVRDVIAEMGLSPDDWFTEVESPGADRVLTEPRHFNRFKGERIKVKLKNVAASPRTFNGSVIGCEDGILKMTVEGASAKEVPLAEIDEARLDPRLPF
jgi:ribosome maturation factor RimP